MLEVMNRYMFDNIYNNYHRSNRVILDMHLLTKYPVKYEFIHNKVSIPIPGNVPCHVFVLPNHDVRDMLVQDKDVLYVDKALISTVIYDTDGRVLVPAGVGIYDSSKADLTYVIIPKHLISRCVGLNNIRNLAMQCIGGDINPCFAIDVQNNIDLGILQDIKSANPLSYVVVNGDVKDPSFDDFRIGDLVMIQRSNIENVMEIDLTESDKWVRYYSDRDECYKYAIPLEVNQGIATDDTIELTIHVNGSPDVEDFRSGLYIHRNDAEHLVVDHVTGNVISIRETALDNFKNLLRSTELTMYIYILDLGWDNNPIIRTKDYVDLFLKRIPLKDKLNLLGMKLDPKYYFWSANHLEQSKYTEYLKDTPQYIKERTINEFVEAMGYYTAMGIVGRKFQSHTVINPAVRTYQLDIPYYYDDHTLRALIHVNGLKVPDSASRLVRVPGEAAFIEIGSSYTLEEGDEIVVEWIETTECTEDNFRVIIADENNVPFDPANGDKLVRVNRASQPIYKLAKGSTDTYYDFIEDISEVGVTYTDYGVPVLEFNVARYGEEYLIINGSFGFVFRDQFNLVNAPIEHMVVDLKTTIDGTDIPITDTETVSVYLNGRALVHNIDYHLVHTDINDGRTIDQLVIQNRNFLGNDTDMHTLEVYVPDAMMINEFNHVTLNSILEIPNDDNVAWIEGLSKLIIGGKVLNPMVTHVIGMDLTEEQIGKIYGVSTTIDEQIANAFDRSFADEAQQTLQAVIEYFWQTSEQEPGVVILQDTHQIYSVLFETVARDVEAGTLQLCDMPDADSLIRQIENYRYLDRYDLTMQNPDVLRLDYLDIYPTITSVDVDIDSFTALNKICKLLLPDDPVTEEQEYNNAVI